MIEREKVVRAVETCFDSWIDGHRNMGLDLQAVEQMKHDALELLKEQETVEPIDLGLSADFITWGCPICEKWLDHDYKYCPYCGRKVKWDEGPGH